MKKYLVSWTDRGASHNGVFYAHNMKELREQTDYLTGHITNIDFTGGKYYVLLHTLRNRKSA